MNKENLIKYFENHVSAKNKAVQLPRFFNSASITKAERKAITDAAEEETKGQATYYMIDPNDLDGSSKSIIDKVTSM